MSRAPHNPPPFPPPSAAAHDWGRTLGPGATEGTSADLPLPQGTVTRSGIVPAAGTAGALPRGRTEAGGFSALTGPEPLVPAGVNPLHVPSFLRPASLSVPRVAPEPQRPVASPPNEWPPANSPPSVENFVDEAFLEVFGEPPASGTPRFEPVPPSVVPGLPPHALSVPTPPSPVPLRTIAVPGIAPPPPQRTIAAEWSEQDCVETRASVPTDMPKQIGRYELIRELGRGGMGVVYLARDSRLGRRVAVKLLHTDSTELTARFIVEGQATAQCDHENIVVIYEVGEHEGAPFMVLEYLQGQTLAALLEKSGPILWTRVADIMVSVLRALVRAHSRGIVHRDLKPENIFLTETGQVKVLDFGIAKVLREEAPQDLGATMGRANNPRATGIAGTLAYMSPEQWWMGGKVDHRADIWAVGIILHEMLTGRHPLLADLDQLQQRVTDPALSMPSVLETKPDVVKELAELVDRCLAKAPSARFPDAESLLKALEAFLPSRYRAWGSFDRGPYTGLRAFQEEDAACFFGRSVEISAIVTRVFDYPMLAVVGPSGSGKSSLIRAGVVPALRSFGTHWRILVVRPGPVPLMALASKLLTMQDVLDEIGEPRTSAVNLGIRLKMEPGYLGQVLRKIATQTDSRVMVFVDQFEELYTLCNCPEQRQSFTQCLLGAADDPTSPVRLTLSIRSDFLGRISEDSQFMTEISKGLFFLGAPSRDGLREALVQPAEMVGYRFESDEMVGEMLAALEKTPGALPLLQFTAFKLWEKRDAARKLLTRQSYVELGGVAGALATHADQTVKNLPAEAQAMCRVLFLQLVTPERTRAVREVSELQDLVTDKDTMRRVLDDLVQSRLLVLNTGGGGGGATVEIVHESLIEGWLTLRRWLEESHEDSMFLEQLRAAARQWVNKRKDSGLLWSGEMAEELFRFRKRYKGELSDTVRAFSDAVYGQLLRRARLKRLLTFSGIGFLVLLLAAAGVALVVISQARSAAVRNEQVAREAQVQAQERLRALVEEERARQLEQAKRKQAETEVAKANTTIDQTKEELAERNAMLESALDGTERQRQLALAAKKDAEGKEKLARDAEERAKELLKREQERAERLRKQLGSPVVEVLK